MGCSGLPKEEKLLENKSFIKYKNIATVEKLEPELTEDFGIIFFMELKNNKFLVSIQNGKVVIYDKKQFKPILIIDLNDYSANYIIKMKSGNFLFGCDKGKLFHFSINEEEGTYKELNSFDLQFNITKILEINEEIIISDYKNIYFIDNKFNDNKLNTRKVYEDHLPEIDIFNIFLVDNLLLSCAYGQNDVGLNEILIHDLATNEIVFKRSKAEVMPWNQSVCKVNSNVLAITGNQPGILLLDIKSFQILAEIKDLDFFYCVICLRNKIFCGSNSGEIYEFEYRPEINEFKYLAKFQIHESSIFTITKTSYGELVTTSRDGTIKFFKI